MEEDPVTEDDEIRLHVAGPDDIDVLWMALGQNPSDEEGESEEQPTEDWPHEYRHYVEGWMRPGDAGVIAEIAATGEGIGAAWHRLFSSMTPRSASSTLTPLNSGSA